MSNEKTLTGSGLSVRSENGLSYHDAITSIFLILINLYVIQVKIKERIISDYSSMNWGSVNNLLLIKEATCIVVPLIILAIIYKKRKTSIGLFTICLILIVFMYVNLEEVIKQADHIGETNVSAFYWAYFEILVITVLFSSAIQGMVHLLKNKKTRVQLKEKVEDE